VADLFMFYMGGTALGASIEVHDVQFAAVDKPEDAFPMLTQRWFGEQRKIHVDTYTRVKWTDGHDVTLSSEPPTSDLKLWFVNMGGYRPGLIHELHAMDLFVAATEGEAKRRAMETLLVGDTLQHKDNMIDVDECIVLSEFEGWYVHLTPNPNGNKDDQPEFQGYLTIGGNRTAWDAKTESLVGPGAYEPSSVLRK
jgi:hypothetical protein